MMTSLSRPDRVLHALNEGLPDATTWTERCDAAWRIAFPCGIQPRFNYQGPLVICTDQIVRAGAMLNDDEFELMIDALVDWVFLSGIPYDTRETPEFIVTVFRDVNADDFAFIRQVAALNGMSVMDFLGANHTEYRNL